jgi:hypothetical protein
MKRQPVPHEDAEVLFERYLAICNEAIAAHEDEFPYRELTSAAEHMLGDDPIDLVIYDDEPKAAFSVRFKKKRLKPKGAPKDVRKAWRVNLSYLRHVAAHPETYIEHPENLDLDWLKSRMGLL